MSLELIIGPMFAGKTSALVGRLKRYKFIGYKCFVITHASDVRYSTVGSIVTHDQDSFPAHPTNALMPLLSHPEYIAAKIIAVEEAHFFDDLLEFVTAAIETHGKQVLCVGLNGDYRRKPIGQILDLVPLADIIHKVDALCPYCPVPTVAHFTFRRKDLGSSDAQILVGGADKYEALCRKHYIEFF